jgi:hypothetical protein
MSTNAPKISGSDWIIDLFPGITAYQLCIKLVPLANLDWLQAAAAVYVMGLLGAVVGIAASRLLRTYVDKVISNARLAKAIGITASLVLAVVLLLAAVAAESVNDNPRWSKRSVVVPRQSLWKRPRRTPLVSPRST